MDEKYSFLVLTDHLAHKPQNPIYSLLPPLRNHPNCACIDVASRSNPANKPFFFDEKNTDLEVLEVHTEFNFQENGEQFVNTGKIRHINDYDCILMRLVRPVEKSFMAFLAEMASSVFINHPLGIEKTSNKSFLLNFPELCPPMSLCHSVSEILNFAASFPIVLKPLKEYGGKGILKIDGDTLYEADMQYNALDYLSKQSSYIEKQGYLAMKYMENVDQGDKRILLVGSNILGASLRIPKKGSWICNVAQGGTSVATKIKPEERKIIEYIAPFLAKEGILIAGVDTLVGDEGKRVLSEINTLSIGGFLNIQEQTGRPVIARTIQSIIDYVHQQV